MIDGADHAALPAGALADDQLVAFDREYVDDVRWAAIRPRLACLRPDFRFVDIGGGNGVFADRVLAEFPAASGVVGDSSPMLLARNAHQERKRTVDMNALDLARSVDDRYDVVCMNWVLHHLVTTGNYASSRANIARTLSDARWMLTPDGRLSVFENMYDGYVPHNAPSHIIHAATSLQRLAPIVRRGGANTAGVGVCFQSEPSWRTLFDEAGYDVEGFTRFGSAPLTVAKRVGLTLRRVRVAHFWLRPR